MGDELKWLLKEESGCMIFPFYMQLVWPYKYRCHAVILQCLSQHVSVYAMAASGACLHLLVPPMWWEGGCTFEGKAPFAAIISFNKSKEGGELFSETMEHASSCTATQK